jgi:hypothetical protein
VHLTITSIFDVFHNALQALAPIVTRVGITWKDGEAYDDWDDIAACLYNNIVLNSIKSADNDQMEGQYDYPKYDFLTTSYEGLSYFQLESKNIPVGSVAAFVRFSSNPSLFLNVGWVDLNAVKNGCPPDIHYVEYSACTVTLVCQNGKDILKISHVNT